MEFAWGTEIFKNDGKWPQGYGYGLGRRHLIAGEFHSGQIWFTCSGIASEQM